MPRSPRQSKKPGCCNRLMTRTLRAAWLAARDRLTLVSDSASLDAQILLADVVGADNRAYLFAHPDQPLSSEQAAAYDAAITRRAQGEPVAYIRGFRAWYDRDMLVTPDVLIPRPETELLLEAALDFLQGREAATCADVCTGSGALAVTLAALRPHDTVYATDISAAALNVARRNADKHAAAVTFYQGDMLAPLRANSVRVDVLLSNPPYIARDVLPTLAVSQYEPALALDGGADGLDFVRVLLAGARDVCQPGALVLVEIGADQGAAVLALAQALLKPTEAAIRQDYAGLDRFLWARL